MIDRRWEVRTCERVVDKAAVRTQCHEAAKEYNTHHEVTDEPHNWQRRVGYWVD